MESDVAVITVLRYHAVRDQNYIVLNYVVKMVLRVWANNSANLRHVQYGTVRTTHLENLICRTQAIQHTGLSTNWHNDWHFIAKGAYSGENSVFTPSYQCNDSEMAI